MAGADVGAGGRGSLSVSGYILQGTKSFASGSAGSDQFTALAGHEPTRSHLIGTVPTRFRAGTDNVADAAGLGAALKYVERIGIENIGRYELGLLEYATYHTKPIPGMKLISTAADKASVQRANFARLCKLARCLLCMDLSARFEP